MKFTQVYTRTVTTSHHQSPPVTLLRDLVLHLHSTLRCYQVRLVCGICNWSKNDQTKKASQNNKKRVYNSAKCKNIQNTSISQARSSLPCLRTQEPKIPYNIRYAFLWMLLPFRYKPGWLQGANQADSVVVRPQQRVGTAWKTTREFLRLNIIHWLLIPNPKSPGTSQTFL